MPTITLEDSTGARVENPSEAHISEALGRIGAGSEHCSLSLSDDSFVQAAGGQNQLLVQYRDASGMFESAKTDFDVQAVTRIFVDAMNGSNSWKTDYNFQPADDGEAAGEQRGSRIRGMAGNAGNASRQFGSRVADQARREATSEISWKISRFVRETIRSIFRGR